MLKRFYFLVIALLLISCASVGKPIDQEKAAQIKEGQTTKQQVYDLIGSPDRVMTMGMGETYWYYSFARVTTKPATFVPVVGIFAGGHNVQSQYFMVCFGPDNIVKRIIASHGATESNLGVNTAPKQDIPDVEQNKRP
jgi:outer membrane protein assembly factor BamE (lipoprotein component of BamABCDE complex)